MFVKQYIYGEMRDTVSISTLIGSSIHKGLEQFVDGNVIDSPQDLLQKCIQPGQTIKELKKTEIEDAYPIIQDCIDDVAASWDLWDIEQIYSNEMTYQNYLTAHEKETLVPIKGKIDLVAKVHGKPVVWDWKTVTSYTGDMGRISYIIQGHIYMALARQQYDEPFETAIFAEIKKTKNRDKSPRVRFVKVPYNATYMTAIIEMANRIVRIAQGEPQFNTNGDILVLPNISDMYSAQESWDMFLQTI